MKPTNTNELTGFINGICYQLNLEGYHLEVVDLGRNHLITFTVTPLVLMLGDDFTTPPDYQGGKELSHCIEWGVKESLDKLVSRIEEVKEWVNEVDPE